MNLIWHITKKDLRRLRVPVAAFAAILILEIVIALVLRSGGGADHAYFERMQISILCCFGLQSGLGFVIVGMLMHEDALVGSRVFWRTRPISGAMLCQTKLLTIACVFLVLPLVIAVPWWVICGFGPGQMATAAVDVLEWQAIIVIPSWALAVMTDNFGRYFTQLIVVLAIVVFAGLMHVAYLPASESITFNALQSQTTGAIVLLGVGFAAIVVHQFRARSLSFAYGGWSLLAVTVPLLYAATAVDLFKPFRSENADSSAVTRAMTLVAAPARLYFRDGEKIEASQVHIYTHSEGIPVELAIIPQRAELTWQGGSGAVRVARSVGYFGRFYNDYFGYNHAAAVRSALGLHDPVVDEETARWVEEQRQERIRKGMPGTHAKPESFGELRKWINATLPLSGAARFEPPLAKAKPKLTMEILLARPKVLAEMPLAVSERVTREGSSLRIAQVRPYLSTSKLQGRPMEFRGLHIDVIETQTENMVQMLYWRVSGIDGFAQSAPEAWLLTRDHGTSQLGGAIGFVGSRICVDGVLLSWATLSVQEPRVIRNGFWTAERDDWSQKMSLAFVGFKPEGEARRTLALEQVKRSDDE